MKHCVLVNHMSNAAAVEFCALWCSQQPKTSPGQMCNTLLTSTQYETLAHVGAMVKNLIPSWVRLVLAENHVRPRLCDPESLA